VHCLNAPASAAGPCRRPRHAVDSAGHAARTSHRTPHARRCHAPVTATAPRPIRREAQGPALGLRLAYQAQRTFHPTGLCRVALARAGHSSAKPSQPRRHHATRTRSSVMNAPLRLNEAQALALAVEVATACAHIALHLAAGPLHRRQPLLGPRAQAQRASRWRHGELDRHHEVDAPQLLPRAVESRPLAAPAPAGGDCPCAGCDHGRGIDRRTGPVRACNTTTDVVVLSVHAASTWC